MKTLTMLEMDSADLVTANRIADRMGYDGNCAYTSTSDIIGLFCMGHNPEHNHGKPTQSGAIIKTAEFGFMWVQTDEDLDATDITQRLHDHGGACPVCGAPDCLGNECNPKHDEEG